jgi:hypothetical protein
MQIRLATTADNQKLLELSRQTPMEGGLIVNVERNPDYFQLANLQGEDARVLVAEDQGNLLGAIGCARRVVDLAGKPTPIAYLGGIKLVAAARKGTTAYRLVKALYDYLLTTDVQYGLLLVMAGNRAMEALLGGRAGIPRFYPITTFSLYYCMTGYFPMMKSGVTIRPATPADEAQLFDLWQHFYQPFELKPIDLVAAWRRILNEPAFGLANFLIAEKAGRLLAAISTWDQRSFKQTVVADYGKSLAVLTAPLRWLDLLPQPGIPIRDLQIRHLVYVPEGLSAARMLIRAVLQQARRRYQFVRLGSGNYYPSHLLKGIMRVKIPLRCYIAPREVTSQTIMIIQKLSRAFIYEDLSLH